MGMTKLKVSERRTIIDGLKGRSLVSINDLTKEEINIILDTAQAMKNIIQNGKEHLVSEILDGCIISSFFFEPSTRTDHSFQWAANKMGAHVISTSHAGVFSSAAKGESLPDTITIESGYCDLIILRHPERGSAEEARKASSVPIINAGDGNGEHPTQALLDLFTIKEIREGEVNGTRIGMMGDLKNGRTIHSLVKLLNLYDGITVLLNSPSPLKLPQELASEANRLNILEVETIDQHIVDIDILYVTRIQLERFSEEEKRGFTLGEKYKINLKKISPNPSLKIMHPFPRIDEISVDIDNTIHEYYFKQADNGKYVRMALLALIFGKISPLYNLIINSSK